MLVLAFKYRYILCVGKTSSYLYDVYPISTNIIDFDDRKFDHSEYRRLDARFKFFIYLYLNAHESLSKHQ